MIKECPVITRNDAVAVVRFGDTDIQFSSIARDAKTVKVKYDNGKYSIVDHAEETNTAIVEKSKTQLLASNKKSFTKLSKKRNEVEQQVEQDKESLTETE